MQTKNPFFRLLSAFTLSLVGILTFTPAVALNFQITQAEAFTNMVVIDVTVNAVAAVAILITRNTEMFSLPRSAAFAIQREVWADVLIKLLFKDNSFLSRAYNDDKFVLAGKVVHVPRSTGTIEVVKNRVTIPATPVVRTREDITYTLDEYTTTASYIPNADKIELSFDAIAAALEEHVESIQDYVADEFLYLWKPTAANIIRTTGANVDAVDAQTGVRKMFMKEQLSKLKYRMNKAKISKENRVALLPSEFMEQLLDDADLKKRDSSLELDMKGGVVTRLYGFDILERSSVLIYDNTGTPVAKLPGAVGAATDNLAALVWQKDCVARAKGDVDMFDDQNNPLYYGDLYSALVRAGGRVRRNEGVYSIVQAVAA